MNIQEQYASKLVSADAAAAVVKSGDWVDYGWCVGTPVTVDKALAKRLPELHDVKFRGGVLLGAPGLTRAYSSSAAESVKNADLLHYCEAHRIRYVIDYTDYGKVSYLLPEFETVDAGSDFGEKVTLLFDIRTDRYPALEARLTELSGGKPALEILETHFVSFP